MKLLTSPFFVKLKKWFTPPVFEDQNKTLMARNSFSLALVGVTTSIFIFIFFLLFAPENIFRLLVIGVSIFFSYLPIVFLRKGHVRAVIYFQASIIWIGVVSTSISTGGVRSIGFIGGTIAALLIMGIALERISTAIFIFVSIVAASLLAWAEARGYIDTTTSIESPIVSVAAYASFLFVLAGLLYVTYRNVTQALAQAHRELAERERAEREREEVIRKLEEEIAERLRLQAEREKIIAQLETNNAELERFTYTVSHDLRSPLVTIKGFLGMLKQDLQDNQAAKVERDMQRIASGADRMDELLTDLLELSRIGRIQNPPEEVDLVTVANAALEMLDGRIRMKNVSVLVLPNLPTVYGERVRLREVFENLIDNAAKYIGDQPNPKIEIGTRNQINEDIIFVKDNGMGIDPRYHNRVFNLFEKLNPTSEGTGIGLALVKRIVETHGGKIWVESDGLGKGTTFCFTIPQ